MDKFGKLQLNESQEILDDTEMKMIVGGYVNYGGHVVDYGGCTPAGGTCQGSCPDYEYQVYIGGAVGSAYTYGSMPRYCVPLNHVTNSIGGSPAISCVCATKDATTP